MNDTFFEGSFARFYSLYMERPWLSRPIARAVWGGDIEPFYESMAALRALSARALVVDAPCGAGVAFRALPPDLDIRYVALDRSPAMLSRARDRAHRLGLLQIECVHGDAEDLPLEDASADLFLSYWGLHCFPHPAQAIREAARVLRPGGGLVGAMICAGDSIRQRVLVRPGLGGFGQVGSAADLEGWIGHAGLTRGEVRVSGAFAYFDASA